MSKSNMNSIRIIAICILSMGVLSIVFRIWGILVWFDFANAHFPELHYEISIPKIVKNYHHGFVTSILEIIAGITLLMKKQIGYYLTFFSCLNFLLFYVISLFLKDLENDRQLTIFILKSLFGIMYLVILLLLLMPKIRKEYATTRIGLYRTLLVNLIFTIYGFMFIR